MATAHAQGSFKEADSNAHWSKIQVHIPTRELKACVIAVPQQTPDFRVSLF